MIVHQNPLRKFDIYQQSPRKKRYISIVAYFDRHGILNDYVVLNKSLKVDWARVIFQTISLKLLMASFLGLEGCQKVTVKGEGFKAVVMPINSGYRAMLYEPCSELEEKLSNVKNDYTSNLVNYN
ncbi:hypothetical protein [Roseofilum sp. Guam]|uniref:hypothetical protein n=1 Tax=Roseofilum sp. Guam TaxID=2821502 RepID=UPI001B2A8210|nr:hypothetical protein [Roseofilum sp. Guam]MBP0029784.1 hypothetical protein [Roseofilum sp. Guam]